MSNADHVATGAATAAPSARRPSAFRGLGALLLSDLALLFRRRRTWALLGALALIPVLLAVAVRLSGEGGGPSFVGEIAGNGLFTGFAAVTVAIPLFLPLTVGVVAGDAIAGEASLGTLRYLLVTPVGRMRLVLVKFVVALAFALAAALTVMVVGLLIGFALFPVGPVTLLSGTQIPAIDAVGRALLIALYVALSLAGLTAIGLFISTLTDVPVGAMAATVVLSITSQILGALTQLSAVHPYLFTAHWLGFGDLLRDPISWSSFGENAVLQLGYVVVFGSLALGRFTTRDVLS
jgi:ABC-2 type transport system permease protein